MARKERLFTRTIQVTKARAAVAVLSEGAIVEREYELVGKLEGEKLEAAIDKLNSHSGEVMRVVHILETDHTTKKYACTESAFLSIAKEVE